jgi:hypothetical protein
LPRSLTAPRGHANCQNVEVLSVALIGTKS